MLGLEKAVNGGPVSPRLLDLVRTRVSQLNGCTFCLDMHTAELRAGGETEQRVAVLAAWRDAEFYTPAERAALALTEALTALAGHHLGDEIVEELRLHFSPEEIAQLTYAIAAINAWNRINAVFQPDVPIALAPNLQHA
jgi:AhpD family alkylhydroperoxidase